MTIRRVLRIGIPLLLLGVLVAGAALAWMLLGNHAASAPARLLVVGADTNVRLLDDDGQEQVIAGDAKTGDYSFPATSPDGRLVAYVSTSEAGSAITVFDLASGERRELYRSRENVPIDLAWSPDGRHIVFLTGSKLTAQIVPADGSRPARLVAAGSPSFFAWSPDGGKLLLHVGGHSVEGGQVTLYQPEADHAAPLFGDPGLFQAPAWSVDGRDLFYVAQPPFEGAQLTLGDLKSDLMRVSAEGKNARLLVREEQADLRIIRAPASDQIAYILIQPDGFGPLKLVDGAGAGDAGEGAGAARVLSRDGEHVTAFFWSPDGRQIAYLTHDGSYSFDGARTWHVVDIASGAVRDFDTFQPSAAFAGLQVFFDAYTFSFSPWSPEGARLAYGARDGVYVIDLAAGAVAKKSDGALAMWVGGK